MPRKKTKPTPHPASGVVSDEIPSFITMQALARKLETSTKTIYRLVKAGKLGHLRHGSQYRFSPQHIAAYEAANSPQPANT